MFNDTHMRADIMKSNVIDGKFYAQEVLSNIQNQIALLNKTRFNTPPAIAIIRVGENPASIIYVNNKLKSAQAIGMRAVQILLPINTSTEELLDNIAKLNNDHTISGIIVQLPLPNHVDKHKILLSIDPNKDVDGFHPLNVGYLYSGMSKGFVPPTALGCVALIKKCIPNLSGKTVTIVGRSNIVGKPLAALLLREDCTITICHSKTHNLIDITSKADIVISAVGRPHLLGARHFHSKSVIIDVGITKLESEGDKTIVGDVDFASLCGKVAYITPVPGGVGPMTIAYLLFNTLKAYYIQHDIDKL